MAGSITVTTSKVASSGGVRQYSIAWTSDASGDVNGNTFTMGPGSIASVEFTPSAVAAPTAAYDVTMLDAEGVNAFDDGAGASIGANLSATASSHKVPFVGGASSTFVRMWLQGGLYEPVVAAAGNAKQGTINIFVAPGIL
jgi:hypothetical protein